MLDSMIREEGRGEGGFPATDEFLSPVAIEEFYIVRLVPALDYLLGEQYMETAPPGSEEVRDRRIPGPEQALRADYSVHIFLNHNQDDQTKPPMRAQTVKISLERQDLERSEELLAFAHEGESIHLDGDEEAFDPADPDEDQLQAWTVFEYYFSNLPDDAPTLSEHRALQDDLGNTLWDDREVSGLIGVDGCPAKSLDEKEHSLFRELQDALPEGLTQRNLLGALAVLGLFGVPEELLFTPDELFFVDDWTTLLPRSILEI